MTLSDLQIKKIARLTFQAPYSYSQLARLIKANYQEIYKFFNSSRSQEYFISAKPWVEILEEANPKLSQGKRRYFKKLVRSPEYLVRLLPSGLDLITARAKVKLDFCNGKDFKKQQQKTLKKAKIEKLIFRKLNYSERVTRALNDNRLDPSDLPCPNHLGSQKYYDFLADCQQGGGEPGGEGGVPEGGEVDTKRQKENLVSKGVGENQERNSIPSSWLSSSMLDVWQEEQEHNPNFDSFGFQEEEELIEIPYSMDRMLELFSRDMWKKFNPFKFGKCSPERFQAIMKLLKANIKNFGHTIDAKNDKGKRIFIPAHEEIKEECIELFQDYLERTSSEKLILMPKKDLSGEPILKPNANRFNNEEKRIDARLRFENIFSDAGRYYKNAIMLTLTSGQWHNNIFEDSKKFQENFNKLMTRLRKEAKFKRINDLIKRNPQFIKRKKSVDADFKKATMEYIKNDNSIRLPYLCVREFQENGNVHFHILIFGVSWLKSNDEISRIWQEYGQGKITKINKIRFNDARGYIWDHNSSPKDAGGRQPLEYLKKYLLKGQYPGKNPGAALLYWVFNSRFFTYSSSLLSDEHKPRPYISKNLYEFFGTCEGGFWDYNGDMLVYYGSDPEG